jgi:TPR repeat protein
MKARRTLSALAILIGLCGSLMAAAETSAMSPQPTLEQVLPLATRGDPKAENEVAVIYANGRGVPQDYRAAVNWLRKAVDQGYAPAEFNLGQLYFAGKGGPKDESEAVRLIRDAADHGVAAAQSRMGSMYLAGEGVHQSDPDAMKWYHLAADQGDALAERQLGLMYELGRGAPRNESEAKRLLNLAAGSGDTLAKSALQSISLNATGQVDHRGGELNEVRDASSLAMAVAMMKGTERIAGEMKTQCIGLHPELKSGIEADYAQWQSRETHAISRADRQWATVSQSDEMRRVADAIAKVSVQTRLEEAFREGGSVDSSAVCMKYFTELASGTWRVRTPRVYQFLDAVP